jgi:glycosyltransferase involved in cell wall biosynthesis
MVDAISLVKRMIRYIYHRLPLGWKLRLALKDWVFLHFAPVLKHTIAFQRWQTFGNGQRFVAGSSFERAAVDETSVSAIASVRYIQNLLDQALGARSSDYVPLFSGMAAPEKLAAKAIAFYLPQFHPIAENDKWWGKGFTEWTNVSKAVPQFVGHHQPKLPGELGFYDLRIIDIMRRQVELAKLYGIHGFCFHYYWFAGRQLLEKPLEQLLANNDIDFPFCICWANENWTRRWDGLDQDVLIGQHYSPEDDHDFIVALEPLLRDPRYIHIDGRPLVVLYRPSILPNAAATLGLWRDHCRRVGIGEIFLAMVQFDVEDPRIYGFDAAIEFPPHILASGLRPINDQLQIINPEYAGYVVDYGSVIDRAREHSAPGFDMIRGVFPSWDNEARKPGRGYTFFNATPKRYREWLDLAIDYARQHPVGGERLVFINAWNEWAEGAYLEPDRRFGYAYLQQTRDALLAKPATCTTRNRRVAIVSHDANPHGAQYLALNLARELKDGLGMQVDVLLLGEGPLASAFAETARVHHLCGMSSVMLDELLASLREAGIELVIANTAVSGCLTRSIAAARLHVITLVHELPKLIRDYGLELAVRELVMYSSKVILPSDVVSLGLEAFVDSELLAGKSVIRPQGLFTRSKYRGAADLAEARASLRARLKLQADARIVLAVGYADRRKGVDLLLSVAAVCCKADPLLHFVWVGHTDESLDCENAAAIAKGALKSRFHFVGMDFQTDDYYAGADLYALSSREDPFPSVVLESLSVGTPVVAFAGTGGGSDLVKRSGGVVVPALDIDQYAKAVTALLANDAERSRLGEIGIDVIDAEFSFRAYAMDLLRLGGMQVPRVSVVVPNFNYARYLPERLASITAQSVPIYEIIILDDGSDDDSIEVIQKLRHSLHPEPRIVVNHTNSGSVFRQWQRGVQLARGDYVWIAEADDLAKPDFLERTLEGMRADPGVVLGYCQSEAIDECGCTLAPDYLAYTNDLSTTRWLAPYVCEGRDEAEIALGVKNSIPNVSAVLFKRQPLFDVLEENIDEVSQYRVAGDWIVYLKLLRSGKIYFDSHVCNRHRRHSGGVTLGSVDALHYQEVVNAQKLAESMFDLSEKSKRAADDYLSSLRKCFGLPDIESKGN